jgi:hypothetical protein
MGHDCGMDCTSSCLDASVAVAADDAYAAGAEPSSKKEGSLS